MRTMWALRVLVVAVGAWAVALACGGDGGSSGGDSGSDATGGEGGSGGSPAEGGTSTGGTSTGGTSTGGTSMGGSSAVGGTSMGGSGGQAGVGAVGGTSMGGSGGQAGAGAVAGTSGASGSGTGGASGEPTVCGDEPLTDWEQMMLDSHHEWRASVDPPAADMYRLYWDRAIVENAAAWVASCDPDWPHSPEEDRSNVGGYEILGENMSYCAGTGCSDLPEVQDDSGLGDGEGWWNERHDYDWDTNQSSGVTSHYLALASSNVYALGCATQRCGPPGPGGWDGTWWWTICQYGPRGQGYWAGTKPYEAGDGGLVEPPPSVFNDHPALCGAP